MFKKIVSIALLVLSPISAYADEWVAGVSLSQFDLDGDVTLNSINGSIGYKFGDAEKGFKFIPEVRLGFGIGDDEIFGVNFEIDNFLALSAKGQYEFENNAYAFALLGWADLELSASGFGGVGSDSEIGFGFGGGYQFNDGIAAEVSFENYDDTDLLSLAVKFFF